MAPREGRLIRPLLATTRAETAAYCRERGLDWREDATNDDPRFARARVRHGLLEQLRAVHPGAERNVVRSAELLRAEAAALDALVAGVLRGRGAIPLAELERLDPAIARLVVLRLAEEATGRLVPDAANRLAQLSALAAGGGSAELHLAGAVAHVEYGSLRFAPAGRPVRPPEVSLALPGEARFGEWRLSARLRGSGEALEEGDGATLLDADALDPAGLTVRAWRAGDRLRPAGRGATKTLADLFGEHRVPRSQRAQLPLIASGGEIVWIPGLATAELAAAGPETRRVAVLTASRG
jgi:tRNA(Ile)-lysidine synthase